VTTTNEEIPRGKLWHIVNNVSHCRTVIDKGGNKGVFDGVASITTECVLVEHTVFSWLTSFRQLNFFQRSLERFSLFDRC
jgi:hypothetical protein